MFGGSYEPRSPGVDLAIRGDAEALHRLFSKSLDPPLDGEYLETHIYNLARTLFELGDHRFASALSKEPQRTRDKVVSQLQYVFVQRHLAYPETQSLSSHSLRNSTVESNQTLQPTPSQLVSSLIMIKMLPEIASRALARRG
jgi:hypothetical protein